MAEERKKILIVDDVKINRIILSNTLKDKYICVEADNGRDALEILKNDDSIRLMLLDISMPELDGFGVLTALRDNGKINSLPVIIISSDDDLQSQIKAFDAGADDIIGKPFNPILVLHRVENLIKRQENAKFSEENRIYKENLNNLYEEITFYELDYKSGLYNQDAFLKKTHELLINNPNKEYVLVRWDIDRFKTYNELFGSEEGDKLLAAVGNFYHDKMVNESVVYGHFEADHFVYCVENKKFNIEQDFNDIQKLLNMYRPGYKFVPHLGAYIISDKSMDVRIMANRAYLALKSTKNKIVNAYAYYDLNMREQLIREQEIISNMNVALKAKQFQVYIQPQYDYSIQGISGGEALVRWLTSEGKIIPPNDFIPIFERNGFIEQLDKYVWEEVCKLIVKWRQNNILHTPISVNISRYDFYDPNLYDYIINLVERYKVKPEWLHLEITESAYMDNPGELLKIVNKLRAYGFLIEMDDFGSGYSSLNTLKNVPVDILKLDMRFLDKDESNDNKGGHILSSIVRMAHWINIPIIAEGVETKAQAEYLKSIGCYYMQGYYFSKPIPNEDFEKLLYTKDNLLLVTHKDEKPVTNAGDFFDASTEETLIFNSYVGGAIIVEYDRVNIEILRANDNFFNVLGIRREDFSGKSVDVTKRLNKENIDVYRKMLDDGITSGKETMCELCSELGHGENDKIYARCRARFLYKKAKSYIFYISVENISQRMELLDRNILLNKELNNVLGNLPGGIINFIYENKVARATYISPTLPAMIGYDYDDYLKSYSQNLLKMTDFNEKELKEVRKILSNAYKEKQFNFRFRVICKDKSIKHFEITGHILDVSESGAITITGLILSVEDKVKNEKVVQHQQGSVSFL